MSHKAQITTQIRSLEALRAAIEKMGLTLEGAGQVRWYQGAMSADYVVKLPGAYDIGFKQEEDGTYSFVCDTECMGGSYSRGAEARNILGPEGGKLINAYVAEYLPTLASGYTLHAPTTNEDGSVTYELVNYE